MSAFRFLKQHFRLIFIINFEKYGILERQASKIIKFNFIKEFKK